MERNQRMEGVNGEVPTRESLLPAESTRARTLAHAIMC